jgi:uncharacterized membrane protein YphA (DoxX/SURF4 family)
MITVDPVVASTVRLALALLFAAAAWHKLRAPGEFLAAVRAYRLAPERTVRPLAAALVVGEAAAVVLLLVPGWSRLGAAVAAALLGLYAFAIAVNLARGRRDLDCGCGGPGARRPVSGALVGRDLALLGAALVLLAPVSGRSPTWVDVGTVLAATATLAALWTGLARLEANRPGMARIRGVA